MAINVHELTGKLTVAQTQTLVCDILTEVLSTEYAAEAIVVACEQENEIAEYCTDDIAKLAIK